MSNIKSEVQLKCDCGDVTGVAHNITPNSGNHVVCCCCDCQSFTEYLGKSKTTLDAFGGTELYQTSQSQVTITQGAEKITCLRLSPKGITRWYTSCCNSPIGNTLNAKMPFIGIIHTFMVKNEQLESQLGPIIAYVQTQYATSEPNYPKHHAKFPLGITLRIITKILGWKIRGMGKPSAFYNEMGQSVVKPKIVSEAD